MLIDYITSKIENEYWDSIKKQKEDPNSKSSYLGTLMSLQI